jgi:hypothetical protein
MLKAPALVCVLLAGSAGLDAQTVSLQEGALRDWTSQRDTLMKIAAAMPEEKFGFRATPAQRTWGEPILHIAESQRESNGAARLEGARAEGRHEADRAGRNPEGSG